MIKQIVIALIVVLAFGLVFMGQADATSSRGPEPVAYLVVMSSTSTGNNYFTYVYHEVPDMDKCFTIIKHVHTDIPDGGDSESSVVFFCTPNKGRIEDWREMNK